MANQICKRKQARPSPSWIVSCVPQQARKLYATTQKLPVMVHSTKEKQMPVYVHHDSEKGRCKGQTQPQLLNNATYWRGWRRVGFISESWRGRISSWTVFRLAKQCGTKPRDTTGGGPVIQRKANVRVTFTMTKKANVSGTHESDSSAQAGTVESRLDRILCCTTGP